MLTGHSLGAALATLMAFDILNEFQNYNLKYLTTYGSPRVGNKEFSSIMNGYDYTSYRVTHYYDIVPHVPEEFMGYTHISNEIWYNEGTQNIQFVMIKWMRMIPVPILVLLQNVLALRIIYIILMLQWEIFEFNSI